MKYMALKPIFSDVSFALLATIHVDILSKCQRQTRRRLVFREKFSKYQSAIETKHFNENVCKNGRFELTITTCVLTFGNSRFIR